MTISSGYKGQAKLRIKAKATATDRAFWIDDKLMALIGILLRLKSSLYGIDIFLLKILSSLKKVKRRKPVSV